ncbi:MAG: hypothetical protein IJU54_01150 [Alphaproteobacteria bacterium]|nr:hypothetical protein [Alphaproteobacteria bacterium]
MENKANYNYNNDYINQVGVSPNEIAIQNQILEKQIEELTGMLWIFKCEYINLFINEYYEYCYKKYKSNIIPDRDLKNFCNKYKFSCILTRIAELSVIDGTNTMNLISEIIDNKYKIEVNNIKNDINNFDNEIKRNETEVNYLTSQIISELYKNKVYESTIHNITNRLDDILLSIRNVMNDDHELMKVLTDNELNYLCNSKIIACMKDMISYKDKINKLKENIKQKTVKLSKLQNN